MIIILMGVSGSGKTTVGQLLANELGWDFFDADDFHSPENREKMSHGIPLTDEDRADWLQILQDILKKRVKGHCSCVLACSALKEKYRKVLFINKDVHFVYLRGTYRQIMERLANRQAHYMAPSLLASQFETLEEPEGSLNIDITIGPKEIVHIIRKELKL
jgi:gluconokinase